MCSVKCFGMIGIESMFYLTENFGFISLDIMIAIWGSVLH